MAVKHNEIVTVRLPRWLAVQLGQLASEEAVRMGHALKRLSRRTVPGQYVLMQAALAGVEAMHGAAWQLHNAEVEKPGKTEAPF